MVLGNFQLGVLRKLKRVSPQKGGLHPSVSGLAKAGFVVEDKTGYSISTTGQLALIAYDDMNEFHRQILMQVNRASANEELYTFDAFKTQSEKDAFDDLLLWEMVAADNDGNITLLENGRILWEVWTQVYALRPESKNGFQVINERQRQKKAKEEKPKAVVESLPSLPQQAFALGQAVAAAFVTPPITQPVSDCPDCGDCIHTEVLDLIAAKYPKVAELRDTLLHQKKLLKELGL